MNTQPRFGLPGRIQAPNAKPRSIALVGLGAGGAAVAEQVRDAELEGVQLRIFPTPRPPEPDALASIKSNGDDLYRALHEADIIFVVARPGDDVRLVPVVARLASRRSRRGYTRRALPSKILWRSASESAFTWSM